MIAIEHEISRAKLVDLNGRRAGLVLHCAHDVRPPRLIALNTGQERARRIGIVSRPTLPTIAATGISFSSRLPVTGALSLCRSSSYDNKSFVRPVSRVMISCTCALPGPAEVLERDCRVLDVIVHGQSFCLNVRLACPDSLSTTCRKTAKDTMGLDDRMSIPGRAIDVHVGPPDVNRQPRRALSCCWS